MQKQEEINELKRQWEQDPCWDIEDTEGFEGFEGHAHDLLAYRKQKEIEWEKQRQKEIEHIADSLGVPGNVKLACAFITLQRRIEELEEKWK